MWRLWITIEGVCHERKNGMKPVHPGEILRDELDELGLSANALSKALGVPVKVAVMYPAYSLWFDDRWP